MASPSNPAHRRSHSSNAPNRTRGQLVLRNAFIALLRPIRRRYAVYRSNIFIQICQIHVRSTQVRKRAGRAADWLYAKGWGLERGSRATPKPWDPANLAKNSQNTPSSPLKISTSTKRRSRCPLGSASSTVFTILPSGNCCSNAPLKRSCGMVLETQTSVRSKLPMSPPSVVEAVPTTAFFAGRVHG